MAELEVYGRKRNFAQTPEPGLEPVEGPPPGGPDAEAKNLVFREFPAGFIHDVKGMSAFGTDRLPLGAALAFSNTPVVTHAARALNLGERLGSIEVGKWADLIVVQGNPLVDIRGTRTVHTVIKGGVLFDSAELLRSVEGRLGPRGPDELAAW